MQEVNNIYCMDIGPGLFIRHGFAIIIAAKKIGGNCWVNQQVTIGWDNIDCPIIEDDCRICAGYCYGRILSEIFNY